MVVEYAYAKINLALEVMEEKDGYHMVNNIMIPIDIYDELVLQKNNHIFVDNDPFPNDNIIVKAAAVFFEYTKLDGGVRVSLSKNIPSAAGLGGGSSDAAATLRGLNKLYEANLTNEELCKLASQLGSDVPFFIECKPALCTNRGEVINPLESNLDPFTILLVKPKTGLSTKDVYKNYVYNGDSNATEVANIVKGLKENNYELVRDNIFNDLEDVALKLNNEMRALYDYLTNKGYTVYVSGSGPTMFVMDNETNASKDLIELRTKDRSFYMQLCNTK